MRLFGTEFELSPRERLQRRDYFKWLCQMIDAGDGEDHDIFVYGVLTALFEKDFYWLIPNDENRAMDGKELRNIYRLDEHKDISTFIDEPCSCLEMLIALAHKWDFDIDYDPDAGDRTSDKFWEMIGNLGLDAYALSDWDNVLIDDIIERWLGRNYRADGLGGLFPLNDPPSNQKKVEIWYQLQQYIIEKMNEEEEAEAEIW